MHVRLIRDILALQGFCKDLHPFEMQNQRTTLHDESVTGGTRLRRGATHSQSVRASPHASMLPRHISVFSPVIDPTMGGMLSRIFGSIDNC
jgi:hypothetical protein